MTNEEYFDTIGPMGCSKRLEVIANFNLGLRSDAARLVLEKRNRRKELMGMGFSFEDSILIVNNEYKYNDKSGYN